MKGLLLMVVRRSLMKVLVNELHLEYEVPGRGVRKPAAAKAAQNEVSAVAMYPNELPSR